MKTFSNKVKFAIIAAAMAPAMLLAQTEPETTTLIEDLLETLSTLFGTVAVLGVTIVAFFIGKKWLKKMAG